MLNNKKPYKEVVVHWVEMRTIKVPEECPTDSISDMLEWIYDNLSSAFDLRDFGGYVANRKYTVGMIKEDSRDYEIVSVDTIYNY